jgi:hypothetical protein
MRKRRHFGLAAQQCVALPLIRDALVSAAAEDTALRRRPDIEIGMQNSGNEEGPHPRRGLFGIETTCAVYPAPD